MKKKYSWDYLIQFNFNPPNTNQLKRSTKMQKEYDNYQKNPLNNLIFSRNLFYNNDILVFIKNRFPYNVADNIAHYILFINKKFKKKFTYINIYKIIKQKYIHNNPFIVFENTPKNRSIKNITHYHVFILKYL